MFTWKFTPYGPEGYCLAADEKPTVTVSIPDGDSIEY